MGPMRWILVATLCVVTACAEGEGGEDRLTPDEAAACPDGVWGGTNQADDCDDCPTGTYCEPGSSSDGVYCLYPCSTDADCCHPEAATQCNPNEWVNSYSGNICSYTYNEGL